MRRPGLLGTWMAPTFGDHKPHKTSVEECIAACMNCARTCNETLSHCLEMGGEHVAAPHIRLLLSCIEICQTAVTFMTRRSRFARQLCKLCAKICDACAVSCGKMADPFMQQCAEVCRQCAKACRAM